MTKSIWKHPVTIEGLQNMSHDTMVSFLEIEFTEIGNDFICAKMPVTHKTVQPM